MPTVRRLAIFATASLLAVPATLAAQQLAGNTLRSMAEGMLVTAEDVTTCPYKLVGPVSLNMRAHSYALKELEPEYIAGKLRQRAKKMDADAVVLVTIGKTHMTLTALRSTPITGRAVSFTDKSCAPTS